MEDNSTFIFIGIFLTLGLLMIFSSPSEGSNEEKEVQNGVLVERSIELKDGRNVTCVTIDEEDNQKGWYRDEEDSQKGLSCDWEHAQ